MHELFPKQPAAFKLVLLPLLQNSTFNHGFHKLLKNQSKKVGFIKCNLNIIKGSNNHNANL